MTQTIAGQGFAPIINYQLSIINYPRRCWCPHQRHVPFNYQNVIHSVRSLHTTASQNWEAVVVCRIEVSIQTKLEITETIAGQGFAPLLIVNYPRRCWCPHQGHVLIGKT